MNKRIKLIIEYDGSNYCGWQIQPNQVTVQGKIEEALFKITQQKIKIHGSGRTDAGVHALGQVAHFDIDFVLLPIKYTRAINTCLPKDISIRHAEEVKSDFHSRYSATGKIYTYEIDNAKNRPAIDRHKVWWLTDEIDFEILKKAAEYIKGMHDFTSFTDGEKKDKNNIRIVRTAEWRQQGNKLFFTIEGNGFLYKMVRIIVGTIIDIARGNIPIQTLPDIFKQKSRIAAGQTAPAKGLCLQKVFYDINVGK